MVKFAFNPLTGKFDEVGLTQSQADALYIRKDGTSVTSANIPFAFGATDQGGSNDLITGDAAFPNRPGTSGNGLSITDLPSPAGFITELGSLFEVGHNTYAMGDNNTSIQGVNFRFDMNFGEPPLTFFLKDWMSLVSGGDLPVVTITEEGKLPLGRGWPVNTNSLLADVAVTSIDDTQVPLAIVQGLPNGDDEADLTQWFNNDNNYLLGVTPDNGINFTLTGEPSDPDTRVGFLQHRLGGLSPVDIFIPYYQ